jgi:hypothetical protein
MKSISSGMLVFWLGLCLPASGKGAVADSVVFTSSNLPVIVIDTQGQMIKDDVRITARMGVINNPGAQRNALTDPFTDYNGWIGIEYRGSSSQMFEKKSYGFETRDAGGSNLDVPLLSMPAENDWVLYAPYSDKTLLRNELPYHLARNLGQYASRTAFCELILNGEYRGIYVLMEKIKRDKNRVNIAKLNPEDTTGSELTGGYILKVDKPYYTGWRVNVTPPTGFGRAYFQYHDPKEDEIVPKQQAYIRNFIFQMESTLTGPGFADPVDGYAKYLDVDSFVDHFLLQEFTKCLDSYRFSFYMHKQKDTDGGKLCAGPIWDFDLAFGNYGEGAWEEPWTTVAWCAEIPAWYRVFWMKTLFSDGEFRSKVTVRWRALREEPFSDGSILGFLDSTASRIEEARVRNFVRWPIIGRYVWPNYYVGPTYAAELDHLKGWIVARLMWMDVALTGSPLGVRAGREGDLRGEYLLVQNFPNPFNSTTTIAYAIPAPAYVTLVVCDALGRVVKQVEKGERLTGSYRVTFDASGLASGVYFYRLRAGEFVETRPMVLLR